MLEIQVADGRAMCLGSHRRGSLDWYNFVEVHVEVKDGRDDMINDISFSYQKKTRSLQ